MQLRITDCEQGMEILRRSSKQRRKATTGLNYSSSRSHSIFTVTVHWQAGPDGQRSSSRISFVDLAGAAVTLQAAV